MSNELLKNIKEELQILKARLNGEHTSISRHGLKLWVEEGIRVTQDGVFQNGTKLYDLQVIHSRVKRELCYKVLDIKLVACN